jgi:aryl-alcohol dehydrogenase-like predicted oxidoreductase
VAVVENQYNLIERGAEDELLPLCREYGVGFVPYYPLANGLLTGKYSRSEAPPPGSRLATREGVLSDEAFDQVEVLEAFARDHGRTLLELAIAGLASQPGIVSVIAGATRPEQVRANAAAGAWEPTPDELQELLAGV